jgi:DNA-directed RNA polymerase beta' subunit
MAWLDLSLDATRMVPLTAEAIRERAPNAIDNGETLDFKMLVPATGGLFDFRVFGGGTVIDAPPIDPDAPYKPRRTRFGRLPLVAPIAHPLDPELVLAELPIVPPELRPLTRLDDDRWQVSPLNNHYRRAIIANNRRETQLLADQIRTLFESEDSLRAICGGTAALRSALEELDRRGGVLDGAPGRVHLAAATLFALGFELVACKFCV